MLNWKKEKVFDIVAGESNPILGQKTTHKIQISEDDAQKMIFGYLDKLGLDVSNLKNARIHSHWSNSPMEIEIEEILE